MCASISFWFGIFGLYECCWIFGAFFPYSILISSFIWLQVFSCSFNSMNEYILCVWERIILWGDWEGPLYVVFFFSLFHFCRWFFSKRLGELCIETWMVDESYPKKKKNSIQRNVKSVLKKDWNRNRAQESKNRNNQKIKPNKTMFKNKDEKKNQRTE